MNIDLAEVLYHDCKSIVDQMKGKNAHKLLFYIPIKILTENFYDKFIFVIFFSNFGLIMLKLIKSAFLF